jgi:hypothetical protein
VSPPILLTDDVIGSTDTPSEKNDDWPVYDPRDFEDDKANLLDDSKLPDSKLPDSKSEIHMEESVVSLDIPNEEYWLGKEGKNLFDSREELIRIKDIINLMIISQTNGKESVCDLLKQYINNYFVLDGGERERMEYNTLSCMVFILVGVISNKFNFVASNPNLMDYVATIEPTKN